MTMSLALLHAGARISPTSFTVHPSTVVGILGLAALHHRESRRVPTTTGQRVSFLGALVVMFLALNGWLHDLSDAYLFSAHMVQHLVLALVVAPFLIMGTPAGMFRRGLALPGVRPVARWLTAPSHCFAL